MTDGSPTAPSARPVRLHYAWIVAGVAFVTLLLASGFRSAPGVLIDPLQEDLHFSRGVISFAIGVNLILFGLTGPFAAAAMQRFGIRRVVVIALCLCATGSGLTIFMTEPWQLVLLWGVVVGLGTGCMASVFAATVANRWFVARRGFVTGVLTAASATGQLAFLPLLAGLTSSSGWQAASMTIAIAALAAIPIVLLLMRNKPEDVGQRAYGVPADAPPEPPEVAGNPIGTAFAGLRMASGSGRFWLLAGSFFVCGASTNGLIGTHFIPAAHDHGMTQVAAASLLATIGVFDIIGTTASGWLTDRIDPRVLLAWYYGLRGLSLLALPTVLETRSVPLLLFIAFYGLDWVATVPPTIALCADVAGPERTSVVFGWVFASHQIGAAVAAFAAGVARSSFGTYSPAFVTAGWLCAAAAALAYSVGRSRRRPLVPVVAEAAPLA
jgi:predicted MFS family arabinose efflux permease